MGARDVSFSEALRRGIGLARRAPGVVGLALGAEVGGDVLALSAGAALAAVVYSSLQGGVGNSRGSFLALGGAAATAALLSLALRLLFAATGARLFAARLAGENLSFGQALASSRLERAVPAAALWAITSTAVTLFDAALVGSALLVAAHALEPSGPLAVSGAAALSAALALAIVLRLLVSLLLPLWLIRAVAADSGATFSLSGALALLGRRLGTLVGLGALFAFFGGLLSVAASAGGAFAFGAVPQLLGLALGARAASGLLAGGLKALLTTVQLGALAAVDAGDRGALPEPELPAPLAEVVLSTEPIVDTSLAPGSDSGV